MIVMCSECCQVQVNVLFWEQDGQFEMFFFFVLVLECSQFCFESQRCLMCIFFWWFCQSAWIRLTDKPPHTTKAVHVFFCLFVFCPAAEWVGSALHFSPPCLNMPPHVAWLCLLANYFPTSLQPEKAVPPPQSNNQRHGEWWEITNGLQMNACLDVLASTKFNLFASHQLS